jgi:protein-L-isoaspartate(D-aspartate) O-methyltransferase
MTDLRGRFVEQIRENGAPLSPELAAAFATVPREAFVTAGFQRRDGTWASPGDADFLDLIYRDDVLVTKVDGGIPVSSSSQPSLMAIMIAALAVRPGMRVLEIGAGTGYNAALLAAIGAEVTSVDVQEDVALRAASALSSLGVTTARVVPGDGYLGAPAGHFDRVIVTVGVAGVSPHWLSQLAAPSGSPAAVSGSAGVGSAPSRSQSGPGTPGWASPASHRDPATPASDPPGSTVDPRSGSALDPATGNGSGFEDNGAVAAGTSAAGSAAVGAGAGPWSGGLRRSEDGLAIVPVEHAGMHPVLAVRGTPAGPVTAGVVCPSGFMSAAGPLTAGHPGAHPVAAPAGSLVEFTQVAAALWDPPLDSLAYRDLWYAAGVWHRRASHAALRRDHSSLALLDETGTGGAVILPSGAVLAGGDRARSYAADAIEILDRWTEAGRPPMQAWHVTLSLTGDPGAPIWVPSRWSLT